MGSQSYSRLLRYQPDAHWQPRIRLSPILSGSIYVLSCIRDEATVVCFGKTALDALRPHELSRSERKGRLITAPVPVEGKTWLLSSPALTAIQVWFGLETADVPSHTVEKSSPPDVSGKITKINKENNIKTNINKTLKPLTSWYMISKKDQNNGWSEKKGEQSKTKWIQKMT